MQVECSNTNNSPICSKEQQTINKSMFFGFKISQKISDCCKKIITTVKNIFLALLSVPPIIFSKLIKIISKKNKDNKEDNKTDKVEHVAVGIKGNENLQIQKANNENIKAKEKVIEASVSVKVDQENLKLNDTSNKLINQSQNDEMPLKKKEIGVEVISQLEIEQPIISQPKEVDETLTAEKPIEIITSPIIDQINLIGLKENDMDSKNAIQPQKNKNIIEIENLIEKENVKEKETINEVINPQQEAYYAKLLEECEVEQKNGYKYHFLNAKLDAKGLVNFKNLLNKVHSDWAIFDQLNMPWGKENSKKKVQSGSALFVETPPKMNTQFLVTFEEKGRDDFVKIVGEVVEKLWDAHHANIQDLDQDLDPSKTMSIILSEFLHDEKDHILWMRGFAFSAFIDKVKKSFPHIEIAPITLPFITYWGIVLKKM